MWVTFTLLPSGDRLWLPALLDLQAESEPKVLLGTCMQLNQSNNRPSWSTLLCRQAPSSVLTGACNNQTALVLTFEPPGGSSCPIQHVSQPALALARLARLLRVTHTVSSIWDILHIRADARSWAGIVSP